MDDTDDVAAAVVQSDLMIWLTPVTFGGYGSQLKKVLDHLICLILPFFKTVEGETHHVPRYEEHPDLLVIGTLPQGDAESEAIFTDLAERNAINMSAPRRAAGVVVEQLGLDVARDRVRALLADVEVM
jgi:multimeric flavodoxin WrbA